MIDYLSSLFVCVFLSCKEELKCVIVLKAYFAKKRLLHLAHNRFIGLNNGKKSFVQEVNQPSLMRPKKKTKKRTENI